jgi:hypothetical protein
MADFGRFQTPVTARQNRGTFQVVEVFGRNQTPTGASPGTYLMRGEDKNIAGLYDVWASVGAPDFNGSSYPSSISRGTPLATPLRNIVIAVPPK